VFGTGEPQLHPVGSTVAARAQAMRAEVDPTRLRRSMETLPSPRVRLHRPAEMAAVDALVLAAFTSAGWPAELREFAVKDAWAWADAFGSPRVIRADALTGVNVIAVKEGTSPEAVVVVAHHDTVPATGGADDNGSGVVALMELARLLGPLRLRNSVVLAAVDLEELGFLGSRQLVSELLAERGVIGGFVYEMIAYSNPAPGSQRLPPGIGTLYPGQVRRIRARGFRGDFTTVLYQQSSRSLATRFAECLAHLAGPAAPVLVRAPTDLPMVGPVLARAVPFARDFARSDHVPFWDAGLPAVQITDTANFRNPHYHRAGDTPDTLDYQRLADVVVATALAVERTAGRIGS
jgi:Zn-dependent M28 family amino/carboxypeptidase